MTDHPFRICNHACGPVIYIKNTRKVGRTRRLLRRFGRWLSRI